MHVKCTRNAPISVDSAQGRFRLLVVVPDELAVGAENHLHILVPQLAGHVPGIGAGRQ